MTGAAVLVALKVAVAAVTVLFVGSLAAVAAGRRRLHGRLNTAVFALTAAAVGGLEAVVRVGRPDISAEFFDPAGPVRRPLMTHLLFAVPAAVVLPAMWATGWAGRRAAHRRLAGLFVALWAGTVVTGLFFLPSDTGR